MFKNATIFRISPDFTVPQLAAVQDALSCFQYLPCGQQQASSCGWVPPRGNKSVALAEPVAGGLVIRLRLESRPVPASAIRQEVELLIEAYKKDTGLERVGAKIKKAFREDALARLQPRAFSRYSDTFLWVDAKNKFLIVDSASLSGSDAAVTLLIESFSKVNGIAVRPLQTMTSAAAAMSMWLESSDAPSTFTVDRDCELKTPDDLKSSVRYKNHTLEIDQVAEHIRHGKVPEKLAMTWNDRVSFVLTRAGQVSKIKLLDVVLDGADAGTDDDGFDADAAIITGELSALIPDLIDALGGEMRDAEGGAL